MFNSFTIRELPMILRLLICLACLCSYAAAPALATEPADLLQRNRELVAKDYEKRSGQLIAARIFLRPGAKSGSVLGVASKVSEIEVVARIKTGEEVVIDRVAGDNPAAFPTIIDSDGLVVGFFRTSTTQEGVWTSARGSFVMYFVGSQSVFSRTGEVRCYKIPDNGRPSVSFSNLRWNGESRDFEFNVRATCNSVDYFGGPGLRNLFVLSSTSIGKEGSYTEEEGRILVQFSETGDVNSATLQKGEAEAARLIRKCEADGRKSTNFMVCGPDADGYRTAYWSYQGSQAEHGFGCFKEIDAIAAGADFLALSCSGVDKSQEPNGLWILMEIAIQSAPRGAHFRFTCTACEVLTARRLAFDPGKREFTFNLETDAKTVDFEGGKFEVPALSTHTVDGKALMTLPVFTVRLNQQWQVFEVSASTGGVAAASAAELPPATSKMP